MIAFLFLFFSFPIPSQAQNYVTSTDSRGNDILLSENRQPALYTKDYGDCQGNSVINVTRFDGAFYRDNMTVTFNLDGVTSIKRDIVMSKLFLRL